MPFGTATMQQATFESLSLLINELQIESNQYKQQRDANWAELQKAKAQIEILQAGKSDKGKDAK